VPLDSTPLTFEGGRFSEVGYPLDALVELARYERLVVQVARGLWMEANPGRQRAPRHFDESLRLRLVDVSEGSVVPVLERHEMAEETQLFDPEDWIGQSQGVITEAIAAVANEQPLPEVFPESGVSSLIQFGSSLLDEEICRFGSSDAAGVRYDQAARRHLIALTSSESIQIDGELLGSIGALDANKQTFDFTDRIGGHVAGAFSRRSLIGEFRSVIDRDPDAPFVRVSCRYTTDEYGRLSGIEDVEELETLVSSQDPLGPPLRELLELGEGWHEGEGHQVNPSAVEWGIDFAAEVDPEHVTSLSVFPTLEGGLLLERQVDGRRWSLEIEPGGGVFVTIALVAGESTDAEIQGIADAVESYEAFIQ
jgi:hypothetical protein